MSVPVMQVRTLGRVHHVLVQMKGGGEPGRKDPGGQLPNLREKSDRSHVTNITTPPRFRDHDNDPLL